MQNVPKPAPGPHELVTITTQVPAWMEDGVRALLLALTAPPPQGRKVVGVAITGGVCTDPGGGVFASYARHSPDLPSGTPEERMALGLMGYRALGSVAGSAGGQANVCIGKLPLPMMQEAASATFERAADYFSRMCDTPGQVFAGDSADDAFAARDAEQKKESRL